jgi:hypothetical protein
LGTQRSHVRFGSFRAGSGLPVEWYPGWTDTYADADRNCYSDVNSDRIAHCHGHGNCNGYDNIHSNSNTDGYCYGDRYTLQRALFTNTQAASNCKSPAYPATAPDAGTFSHFAAAHIRASSLTTITTGMILKVR